MSNPERPKSTLFDDLKTRSVVALVMAVVAFGFLWVGGLLFALFMGAVALMMLLEFTSLIRKDCDLQDLPKMALIGFGAASVVAMNASVAWFLGLAGGGVLIAATLNSKYIRATTPVGYALIVMGAGGAVFLRDLPLGFALVLWIVLCVIAADIGGYAFGRLLQGPKLIPSISPKKTWSGFLGGVILAVLVALIYSLISGGSAANLILFGALISVVSVAGDLLESSAKRKFGVKDASNFLPGHGGFLDRLDGMTAVMVLFAALALLMDLGAVLLPDYVTSVSGDAL